MYAARKHDGRLMNFGIEFRVDRAKITRSFHVGVGPSLKITVIDCFTLFSYARDKYARRVRLTKTAADAVRRES